MKWLDASTAAEVLKFTIRKVLQKTENLLEKGKKLPFMINGQRKTEEMFLCIVLRSMQKMINISQMDYGHMNLYLYFLKHATFSEEESYRNQISSSFFYVILCFQNTIWCHHSRYVHLVLLLLGNCSTWFSANDHRIF